MTIENPYGLPREFARAVARDWLDPGCAIIELALAAIERERVTPYRAPETFRGLKHLYGMHLERERMAIAIAAMYRRWAQRETARENRHGR